MNIGEKNRMIEESLERAIRTLTPEMPEALQNAAAEKAAGIQMQNAAAEKAAGIQMQPAPQDEAPLKKKSRILQFAPGIILAAAAVILLVAGGLVLRANLRKTVAVVDLDVNPSIEFSINSRNKVTKAEATNAEGQAILSKTGLLGSNITDACNEVAKAMMEDGYLSDTTNSLLVSVRAKDSAKGKEIEKELAESLLAYLEKAEFPASILGQFVEDDTELADFAEKHGISIGKAWLIRALLASGNPKLTEESLLKLSTQELILLGQEKHVQSESSYGKADTSKYIGEEKAAQIALKDANLTADQVTGLSTEFDCDDGTLVYEVEFRTAEYEYEYDINAETGAVVFSETEPVYGYEKTDDADDADDDDAYDDDADDDGPDYDDARDDDCDDYDYDDDHDDDHDDDDYDDDHDDDRDDDDD